MSKTVQITSANHFGSVLQASKFVVADFYADWSGPCNQIAPIYDQLAAHLTREGIITFAKINHERYGDISKAYDVTSIPTFIIFRDGRAIEKVKGADPKKLQELVKKLASEAESAFHEARQADGAGPSTAETTSGPAWQGASIPRGYSDISDQIELKGCEVLNADTDKGSVRALFDPRKPSVLQGSTGEIDWVESDTDEQLMLFTPFQSMIKLHTVQITSIPPTDEDDDEAPMRPKTLKLYPNRPHNLGFDEAESTPAAQEIVLSEKDWNADGTANVGLRFVKFQNITSLVIFVVDGDGDSEKVRLDRVRLIGETGVKRDLGTLEKIGDS